MMRFAITLFLVGCAPAAPVVIDDAGCSVQRHYNRVAAELGCTQISTCPRCEPGIEDAVDCAALEYARVACEGDGG